MIIRFLVSTTMAVLACPAAMAENFDMSASGPDQFLNAAQVSHQQIFNALEAQNMQNAAFLQANALAGATSDSANQQAQFAGANAQQQANMTRAGQQAYSAGATGSYGRWSNPTGTGPSGVGCLSTATTGSQTPLLQNVGTMGLAPVFGYGAPSTSPGGYVSGISVFGLGIVRLPSTIGLPGGGAVGVPQLNYGNINSTINGAVTGSLGDSGF
jgi:hypothetical protein